MTPDWHQWDDPPRLESQRFLTETIAGHSEVLEVVQHDANRYTIRRMSAVDRKVFLTNVYILGEADYLRLRATDPEVDLIILASTWNACTIEVKKAAMDEGIAIHTFKTLMGALNRNDDDEFVAHGYSPTDRAGRPLKQWP